MQGLNGISAERLEKGASLAAQGEFDRASELFLEQLTARPGGWNEVNGFIERLSQKDASIGIEVCRRLGSALAQRENFEAALDCWRRVEELCPEDSEAAGIVSRLTIQKSRQLADTGKEKIEAAAAPEKRAERHLPTTKLPTDSWFGPRREVSAPYSPPPPTEIALTETQRLEKAIRDCPADPDNYLQLVPLYLAKGRDFDAERLLAKGREATEEDLAIRRLWEDVLMLRLEKKVTRARQQVEAENSEKARAELEELVSSRDRLESEIFHSRCQREPTNPALRFELGLRLKRAGDLREAFKRFEEALPSPAQKCAAAFEMGDCLQQFGDLPEALRYYRISAESGQGEQDLDCQKRALHKAARLAVHIKLPRVAQRYLADLLRLDPNCQAAKKLQAAISGTMQ